MRGEVNGRDIPPGLRSRPVEGVVWRRLERFGRWFLAAVVGAAVLVGGLPAETAAAAEAAPGYRIPSADRLLSTLREDHPRLILLNEDLPRIRHAIASNPTARRYYRQLQREGDRILREPPVRRVLIGPRLLDKSRKVVARMYALGLLYRLDGNKKWADRALKEMKAVEAFSDWHPAHFLDVAEMTHGVAIAYDWFYSAWTPEQRQAVLEALVNKGLMAYVRAYQQKAWWTRTPFNWNNVCNGGLIVGALAVARERPELARSLLSKALKQLPLALASYAPDGAWAEGPGYWSYATRYTVAAFAALRSALGTDFGLSDFPGLSQAGMFRVYDEGPTGFFFNFADAGERAGNEPSLFWLARRYHQPVCAFVARRSSQRHGSPRDLIWFDPSGSASNLSALKLDRFFHRVNVVFFRSAWNDPKALFVGFKGGDNKANHAHLDLGTFVFDAQGERWVSQLGPDDYNLPGYFGKLRWTYYRLRTEGQNTLLLNDEKQDPRASAPIIAFQSHADRTFAVADLTAAYRKEGVTQVRRGVALVDHRRELLVQDEIESAKPVKVRWLIHTRARVHLQGSNAVLERGGKEMQLRILSPARAQFRLQPIHLTPPQRPLRGMQQLEVDLPGKVRRVRLAVLFAPEGKASSHPTLRPLSDWAEASEN